MSGKIFISYRRADASADARSVYQFLEKKFGEDKLFIDVDTIEKGRDFRNVIESNLEQCKAFIAIIGRDWLDCRAADGSRRIDDKNDFVRLEIAKALEKPDLVVIPVLLDGVQLPAKDDLPKDLQGLSYRQAALVRHETFAQDMHGLVGEIEKVVAKRRLIPIAAMVGGLVVTAIVVALLLFRPSGQGTGEVSEIYAYFNNGFFESEMTICRGTNVRIYNKSDGVAELYQGPPNAGADPLFVLRPGQEKSVNFDWLKDGEKWHILDLRYKDLDKQLIVSVRDC